MIRLFAEQQGIELAELNFERNPEYAELFVSNDPKHIVATLRLMLNKIIRAGLNGEAKRCDVRLIGKGSSGCLLSLRWLAE